MEVPWQNWFLDLDMDETGFFKNYYSFEEDENEFLKDIFHNQPCFSSESDSTHSSPVVRTNNAASDGGGSAVITTPTTIMSSYYLDIDSGGGGGTGCSQLKPDGSSSVLSRHGSFSADNKPTVASSTYILSFDNSTVLPANSGDGYRKHESGTIKSGNKEKLENSTGGGGGNGGSDGRMRASSQKRTLENQNSVSHQEKSGNNGTKRSRNSSETLDHIMAERKRRQELTEKFIALSATIPGLKKIDKASILSEAIIHVKQLQERVKDLEEQNKKMMTITTIDSTSYKTMKKTKKMMMRKKKLSYSSLSSNNKNKNNDDEDGDMTTTTSDDIDDDYFKINESAPEVEARVLESEVLIRIHCENQKGVIVNLLAQLHNLHFSIITHSALPFGNSILDITIIAMVDEEHSIPMKELVRKLRMALLKKKP